MSPLGPTFCAAAIICLANKNTLAALILGSCSSHTCAVGCGEPFNTPVTIIAHSYNNLVPGY